MNILLSIAITTGILSGIWGWVAVSLGLLSWAGFLGCTAYFACPQGGLKGLAISAATLLSKPRETATHPQIPERMPVVIAI
ncbi:DUF1097 domain-containing protein, partial [Escherichia sp. SP-MK2]